MTPVHTKLHLLQQEGFGRDIAVQAHYVVQDDVIDAVYSNGHRLARAAEEMYAAGRLALPFDSVLVEADLVNSEDGTEPQTRPKHVRL